MFSDSSKREHSLDLLRMGHSWVPRTPSRKGKGQFMEREEVLANPSSGRRPFSAWPPSQRKDDHGVGPLSGTWRTPYPPTRTAVLSSSRNVARGDRRSRRPLAPGVHTTKRSEDVQPHTRVYTDGGTPLHGPALQREDPHGQRLIHGPVKCGASIR